MKMIKELYFETIEQNKNLSIDELEIMIFALTNLRIQKEMEKIESQEERDINRAVESLKKSNIFNSITKGLEEAIEYEKHMSKCKINMDFNKCSSKEYGHECKTCINYLPNKN